MAKDATKIRIGECDVYLDHGDGLGERDLGHTKGGAEFTINRDFAELLVDKWGSAPIDKVLTGNQLMIKIFLAEPSTLNQYEAVPEGLYGQFPVSSQVPGDNKLGVGRSTGFSLASRAGVMRLHPRKNTPTNLDEDIYIWKAVSVENITLPFKVDEQRILEVTFEALVDESQPDGQVLGRVGNATIS